MNRLTRAAAGLIVIAAVLPAACRGGEPESGTEAPVTEKAALPEASGFDFFVLSLSWSPSYCASEGKHANRQQCGSKRPFAFVVHGLWPQYLHGYPSNCPTGRQLTVPRPLSDAMLDIMPSTGLIRHEWTTHGTCSGLSPEDYFATTRAAFGLIAIPEQFRAQDSYRTVDPASVETAFMAANPGLAGNAVAVTCDRRYLREVRICMKRDLSGFVACPEVDGDACAISQAVMPPAK